MESDRPLSAEEAAAIWHRAAELQSEAAQRMEERSRALSANAAAQGSDPEKFSLTDVRAAAEQVGITPEFITLAINELQADPIGALPPDQDEKATRFLGTADRSLEISRTVGRPVADVYNALQRVLPAYPWQMTLRDVSGDPLAGGPMIFNVPAFSLTATQMNPLAYYGYSVDVNQIQLILRRVAAPNAEACEILLRAGLHRSVRRNFRFGRWSSVAGGAVGAGIGGVIGAAALGVAGAMLVVPVAIGGAIAWGGSAIGYRKSYRYYLAKFTETLNEMLGAVAVHAKTGGAFAPVTPTPPPSSSGNILLP